MRISEILVAIASWLESPENEAMLLSEYDDKCLESVASSCIKAAAILKAGAEEVEQLEPKEEDDVTTDSIETLAEVANALDASNDENLKKSASELDKILKLFAADDSVKKNLNVNEKLHELNKTSDTAKKLKESNVYKDYFILEAPLSTRYCPDHTGVPVSRIGNHVWQCNLDKKVYDYDAGFTLANGDKVPGGSVSGQSAFDNTQDPIFKTRDSYSR